MTPNRLSEAFDIAQKINDKIEPPMSVTLQVNLLAEAVMWMRFGLLVSGGRAGTSFIRLPGNVALPLAPTPRETE